MVLSHCRIIVSSSYIILSYIIVSYLICYGILSPYHFVVLSHHHPKALLCYIITVLSYHVILVVSHYRMIGKEKERRKNMKSKSALMLLYILRASRSCSDRFFLGNFRPPKKDFPFFGLRKRRWVTVQGSFQD